MSDIKKGDRVRLAGAEFEVVRYCGTYATLYQDGAYAAEVKPSYVPLEKIEPPVEVFGKGDVVRTEEGRLILLGREGYTYLQTGQHRPFGKGLYSRSHFTSENFQKVNLTELPF